MCCLMASRTRKAENLPNFDVDDTHEVDPRDERPFFPGIRIAGGSQPISCRFPRSTGGGLPSIEMIGSTATRVATPSKGILTSSLRLALESESETIAWSDIAATPGHVITRSDLTSLVAKDDSLLDLAHQLGLSLTRQHGDEDVSRWEDSVDKESFDLSNHLKTIFDPRGPVGAAQEPTMVRDLQSIDIGVVLILSQSFLAASDSNLVSGDEAIQLIRVEEGDFVQQNRDGQRSVGVLVRSRHVARDVRAAKNDARKLQARIHCVIDILSGHLFLQEAAFQVRKQLMDLVSDLVSEDLDSRERQEKVSDIWQLRTESLWRYECPWMLTPKGGLYTTGPRALEEISSTLGMTRECERCKTEVDRILAVADYSASHEVEQISQLVARMPKVPDVHFPDPLLNLLINRPSKHDDPGLLRSIFRVDLLRALRLVFSDTKSKSTDATKSEPTDTARRLVEIHPFQNRETIIGTIGSRITTSALLTATAGLLLGLLLSGPGDLTSPHDALLLLVATISFLFETLMLANVSRDLQFTTLQIARNAERASGVALFLGQYPFAIALALSMTRLIAGQEPTGEGTFLIIVVSVLTLIMMILYFDVIEAGAFGLRTIVKGDVTSSGDGQPPKYSVFGPKSRRQLMAVLHSFAALLLIGSVNSVSGWISLSSWLMWSFEFALLGILMCMAAMSWVVAGSERYRYYEVDEWDYMGAERASFFDADWRGRGS